MIIRDQLFCNSTEEQIYRKEKVIRNTRTSYLEEKYLSPLDEEEKKYMRDFFGGMEEALFPATAGCFQDTVVIAEKKGLPWVTGDDSESGWSDGIFLKAIKEEEENYQITAGATVIHPVWELAMEIDFYTVKDGEPVVLKEGNPFFVFPYEQNVEAELAVEKKLAKEEMAGIFLTVCMVGQDDIMRFKTKAFEFSSWRNDYDMLSAVFIDDPVKKQQSETGKDSVIVCYDRVPSLTEQYDYLLYFLDGGFYIPTRGKAVFSDKNQRFAKVLSIGKAGSSSTLALVRKNGGGFVSFQNDWGKDFSQFFSLYVDPETKLPGFQWDFKTAEWQVKNPLPAMEILEMDYSLTVSYQVVGSEDTYHMLIYSGRSPVGSSKEVASIALYWGCLYKDTRITMADFTEVKIQDVKPGDMVYSDKGPLRIRDVVTGQEMKGIYKLTAGKDGEEPRELYLTAEHPVVTDEGIKILLHIMPYVNEQGKVAFRERVRTVNGNYIPVRSLELTMVDDSVVYNLVLESSDGKEIPAQEAVFYADGLAVGDNQTQRYAAQMEEERLREAHGLDERWRVDVETIKKYFVMQNREGILWKNQK